jgi:hypothetical protein
MRVKDGETRAQQLLRIELDFKKWTRGRAGQSGFSVEPDCFNEPVEKQCFSMAACENRLISVVATGDTAMGRRVLFLTLVALFLTFTAWKSPAMAEEPVDLSGRWRGTWVSCKSGHKGILHAHFCKINDNCYRVSFTGTFALLVPFYFAIDMPVTGREGDKLILSGSHQLPLFGKFEFTAVAANVSFLPHIRLRMTRASSTCGARRNLTTGRSDTDRPIPPARRGRSLPASAARTLKPLLDRENAPGGESRGILPCWPPAG